MYCSTLAKQQRMAWRWMMWLPLDGILTCLMPALLRSPRQIRLSPEALIPWIKPQTLCTPK